MISSSPPSLALALALALALGTLGIARIALELWDRQKQRQREEEAAVAAAVAQFEIISEVVREVGPGAAAGPGAPGDTGAVLYSAIYTIFISTPSIITYCKTISGLISKNAILIDCS